MKKLLIKILLIISGILWALCCSVGAGEYGGTIQEAYNSECLARCCGPSACDGWCLERCEMDLEYKKNHPCHWEIKVFEIYKEIPEEWIPFGFDPDNQSTTEGSGVFHFDRIWTKKKVCK